MACLSPSHSKAEQPKSLPVRDITRAQGAGEHGELSPSSWQPGRRQRERGQQQGVLACAGSSTRTLGHACPSAAARPHVCLHSPGSRNPGLQGESGETL